MSQNIIFEYFCYRCGTKNTLSLPCPTAPEYHHSELQCRSCGDATRVLLTHCPSCERFVYWIDDTSIPDLLVGFAKYMVHSMQTLIDKAAMQNAIISIDTPDVYPIYAKCPCGKDFSVDIKIPDLD